jgi:lysozyme
MRRIAALALAAAPLVGLACSSPQPGAECVGSSSDAIRVCAPGPVVKGVDVSYYQGVVSWSQVKQSGRTFAIARVSDGLSVVDTQFASNWSGIRQAGLVRGVYQFFRPARDPIAQADLLLQKVQAAGGFQPGDLPPVLDIETVDGVSVATLRQRMQQWLDRVEQALGRRPIIYTAAFMSQNVGTGFSRYPLWVANYGVTCPTMPDGWSTWKFWQSSSTGSVPGISGNVDVNDFNGTLADLRAFAGPPPLDAGPPPPAAGPVARADLGANGELAIGGQTGQGSAMGDGRPEPAPAAAPDPCAPVASTTP